MSYRDTNDTWCSPPYSEVTAVVTIVVLSKLISDLCEMGLWVSLLF